MRDPRDMRNDETEGDMQVEPEREGMDPDRAEAMNREDEVARRTDMRERDDMVEREDMRRRDEMTREPVMATNTPDTTRDATAMSPRGDEADMWPDMGDLRQRFEAIQSEFIDDPKGAVTKAEGLIKDVVERITRSMHERIDTMHRGVESTDDTEQLRQTMRGYRDLVVWMETRRAA
jgi:hypothetical protein